jgi:hypothetical protein
MNCVLTIFAILCGVSGNGVGTGLHEGQPARTVLTRALACLLPWRTPSATEFLSTPPAPKVQGSESPETEGIPKLPHISRRLNALLIAVVFAIAGIALLLYIGELVILGWVVDVLGKIEDFLSEIGMPKIQARPDPLDYEQVGEIIVVTLRKNIATIGQCQSVQKQLKSLIDEHHCDFVLDFYYADRISKAFRGVMVHLMKAARREAARLGKPYRPVAAARGKVFRVFVDRQHAVEEMSKHDGHGWVVLCGVPVGVRAISDLN